MTPAKRARRAEFAVWAGLVGLLAGVALVLIQMTLHEWTLALGGLGAWWLGAGLWDTAFPPKDEIPHLSYALWAAAERELRAHKVLAPGWEDACDLRTGPGKLRQWVEAEMTTVLRKAQAEGRLR